MAFGFKCQLRRFTDVTVEVPQADGDWKLIWKLVNIGDVIVEATREGGKWYVRYISAGRARRALLKRGDLREEFDGNAQSFVRGRGRILKGAERRAEVQKAVIKYARGA